MFAGAIATTWLTGSTWEVLVSFFRELLFLRVVKDGGSLVSAGCRLCPGIQKTQ